MYIFTSYNLFFLYPGGYCVQFNHFPDVPCIFSAFLLAKQLAGRSAKIPRNSVATSATSPSRQIHEKFQRQTAVEGHQASQITLILDDSESDFTFWSLRAGLCCCLFEFMFARWLPHEGTGRKKSHFGQMLETLDILWHPIEYINCRVENATPPIRVPQMIPNPSIATDSRPLKHDVSRKTLANSLFVFLHPDPRMSRCPLAKKESFPWRNGSEFSMEIMTGVMCFWMCFCKVFFSQEIEFPSHFVSFHWLAEPSW